MPLECRRSASGGKGNKDLFFERDSRIVAAGLPSAQQDAAIGDSLQHYLLKDETDALIGDAIIPPPKARPLPPLRKPLPLDKRNASCFGDVALIINPPLKTKFQLLANDFMETSYKSYWNLPVGKVKDPTPMLPEGFDVEGTTFGKPTPFHGRLYDIIMPIDPVPDITPPSKCPGAQTNRNYCRPSYNPDLILGHRTFVDRRGTYARCCLTDDRIAKGLGNKSVTHTIQANLADAKQPRLGIPLAPYNNISQVPDGYAFGIIQPPGNIPECLSYCELNQGVGFFKKCFGHLNTVRRALSKRIPPKFFHHFKLTLKRYDTQKTGWLPKDIIYKQCQINLIRFDPKLIEPLLSMWKVFDGSNIEYNTFVSCIINYREPSPEIPKIPDMKPDCLDYSTTYTDMVKPGQEPGNWRMAGLPTARYFDKDYPVTPNDCCKADRTCLPEESDAKSCICPSILTNHFVSHRDMYEKQEPQKVRRVFEAAGEKFSDKSFEAIWKEAQKLHSQGWVCYETFRRALANYSQDTENQTNNII